MANSDSLTFARLVDWVEGHLSAEEAEAVAEQVAMADQAVRSDVAWLRAFLDSSATIVLAAPPEETHTLLRRRFEAYARSRPQPSPLRRLVAILTFDSGLHPTLAGVRAAGVPGTHRQLVYATDVADIVLNIQPRGHDQNLDLSGQIFPKENAVPGSFDIQLLQEADELASTAADDLGEFVFEALPPAVYNLTLHAEQIDVLIPMVELHV